MEALGTRHKTPLTEQQQQEKHKLTKAKIREQLLYYYASLARPTLEYGSIDWDPHQASRIKMLESVQNKGTRYVTREWSRYSSISDIKRTSKNHPTYSYHTLRARTVAYIHSFLPSTIRAWNISPQDIVLPSPRPSEPNWRIN